MKTWDCEVEFNPLPNDKILDYSKLKALVEDRINVTQNLNFINPFPKQAFVFTCLQYKSYENAVAKGEIYSYQAISLFTTVFSTLSENFPPFLSNSKLSSANSFQFGRI